MTFERTHYAQEINITEFLKQMEIKQQERSFLIKREKKAKAPLQQVKKGLQSFLLQTL